MNQKKFKNKTLKALVKCIKNDLKTQDKNERIRKISSTIKMIGEINACCLFIVFKYFEIDKESQRILISSMVNEIEKDVQEIGNIFASYL